MVTEERRELESLARRRSTGQALALRSRIVLAAAEGVHNGLIAERLGIFRGTVGKWRERFARDRLDGLYDEPRPGAPHARSAMTRLPTRSAVRWKRTLLGGCIGACAAWPRRLAMAFDGPSHLEGLRPAAASQRDLQAVKRSAVRGEGARHCRA